MGHGAADLWPVRVLFLCWHIDLLSPLAEAILNHRVPGPFLAHSAGTAPTCLQPLALSALADIGVDSAGLYAKGTQYVRDEPFDVVTLCECTSAARDLPVAAIRLPWAVANPLAAGDTAAQRAACAYATVSDGHAASRACHDRAGRAVKPTPRS